jgi:molecular chaperone DnaK
MGKVIGIDLGTTKCCVAVLEGGQPIVIANSEGGRTTPSMVGFGRTGDRCIGQLAQRQSVTNAENTVFSIKRLIGRRWENTEQERSRVPYTCVFGRGNTVDVQIRGKTYTPQEISAMVLQKLKQDAENYLGETVTQAVIAVPACFNAAQRQAIKDAGTIAGLEVLQIISEPMAAALAYGLNRSDQDERIIVFDLGGGTCDVSILQLSERGLEMIATCGSNQLGGDDFDDVIVRWILETFKEQEGIDLAIDKMALQRLREAAAKAKIELSYTLTTSVNLPFIAADETGPKHLEIEVTRTQFEALISPFIQEIIQITEQMLKKANLTSDDYFDHILLIGGSTRIPAVYQAIW